MAAPDKNTQSALSLTSAINSIVSFFNSQDNNSAWKSLTTTSEGSFLIRLLGTVVSNLSYRIVSYFRENFLSTCTVLSSALGIGVTLGYSGFRGANQRRIITVTPKETVTIPKYSIIGSYNSDYSIINIEDLYLQVGQTVDITVVIGNVKTIQQTAGTSNLDVFSFYTQNISEDLILLNNGVEVPYSKKTGDMSKDVYCVRTNPQNSIDILYLNNISNPAYPYAAGTVFIVKYVELADVPTIPFTNDMFVLSDKSVPFTLNNTRTIQLYVAPETVNSIKVTAPNYHETQGAVKSKEDFSKVLPDIDTAIIKSNYNVIVPSYAAVSYIKNDYTLLTQSELTNIINTLNTQRSLGIPLPDLCPPNLEIVTLDISFKYNNQFTSLANVNSDIVNLLSSNYYQILKNNFSTLDLESLFKDNLSYVKNARVSILVNDWAPSTYRNVGDVIEVNNTYYKATAVLGKSGNSEPSWVVPVQVGPEIDLSFAKDSITGNLVINYEDNIAVGPPVASYSRTFTGSITTGSNVVTNIPSAANLTPGIPISCTGIPANTVITSIDSASQIHISQNATATATSTIFSYNLLPLISIGVTNTGVNYFEVYGNQTYTVGTVVGVFINNELFQSLTVQNLSYNNITNITTTYVNETIEPIIINVNSAVTYDNTLVWKTYKRLSLDNYQISEWESNANYKINDYVYSTNYPNYMFKVVDIIKYSSPLLPPGFATSANLGGVGTFVTDNDLVWVGVLLNSSDPVWSANTNYALGDRVQVGTYSYEVIGYCGKSSATQPVFELSSYPISSQAPLYFGFVDFSASNNTVVGGYADFLLDTQLFNPGSWVDENNLPPINPPSYFNISGDYAVYFSIGDILQVFTDNGTPYSFSVSSVSYASGITTVGVNQPVDLTRVYVSIQKMNVGTKDTNLFWEIIDGIDSYSGGWNVYNIINYNLGTL